MSRSPASQADSGDRLRRGGAARFGKDAWALPLAALVITAAVGAIAAIPSPAYFLVHMVNDPVLYFVMARAFAQHGTAVTSMAENTAPFTYAFGMAYVYGWVFKLFSTYEQQIRGIQAVNLLLIFAYLALSLRFVAAVLPRLPVALFAAIFGSAMLLDYRWHNAALMPNSDILPGVLTMAAILIARPAFQPGPQQLGGPGMAARALAVTVLGGMGLFVKMSLVILPLAFFFLLAMDKGGQRGAWFRRFLLPAILLGLLALFYANKEVATYYLYVLFNSYLFPSGEISAAGFGKSLVNWVANLVFSALPGAIIPKSRHLFFNDMAFPADAFQAGTYTGRVALGMILGAAVTGIMALGASRLWMRCRYEFVCLMLCLPVFAVVHDSTARYLIPFQALAWVAFIAGLPQGLPHALQRHRAPVAVGAAVLIAVFIALQARFFWNRPEGDLGKLAHIREAGRVYGEALAALRTLPLGDTRLLHFDEPQNRSTAWRVATDLTFYAPDADLPQVAANYRTLFVVGCVDTGCDLFDKSFSEAISAIRKTGDFEFALVKSLSSSVARVEIHAIRAVTKQAGNRLNENATTLDALYD